MTGRKKILLIYTGGTIGMIQADDDGAFIPFNFELIRSQFPELEQLGSDIEVISYNPPLDSSNMGPESWVSIVHTIADWYSKVDGFVILHGTDTMAYTGSALSFMLEGLAKPVILTGAQLSINQIRTDAKENLVTAIQIASHPELPIREVAIYFQNRLYRANRTKKMDADDFAAFNSPNFPALGEAGVHLEFEFPTPEDAYKGRRFRVFDQLEYHVGHLRFYPGLPPEMMDTILLNPKLKGVILQSYGSGNLPTSPHLIATLKKAIDQGKTILNITQCSAGTVEMGRYATSTQLLKQGIISGKDLTFEAALSKMMYLMGKYKDADEVRFYMERNIRGEMRADKGYTT
ncbi:MAG TPA: asparaginase [Bacteroidetes bacterium]|nr:asparaginase [Bacteroidota bacterium]